MDAAEADALIDSILAGYDDARHLVELFREQLYTALISSVTLEPHVHSIRSRLKDRDHLDDKLRRKLKECVDKGDDFDVTPENLLVKINDLAGVRILHLYTRQIRGIDAALREIFDEQTYDLVEGPFARTW